MADSDNDDDGIDDALSFSPLVVASGDTPVRSRTTPNTTPLSRVVSPRRYKSPVQNVTPNRVSIRRSALRSSGDARGVSTFDEEGE